MVTDPRACQFDPAVIQCKDHEGDGHCLSPSQVKAVRAIYTAVKTSQGETASYPLSRGSEGGWSRFISTGSAATPANYQSGAAGGGLGGLRALVFNDANFDLAAFNPERDYATVRHSAFAAEYEAKDPDISAFVNAGGKLLLWHGWDDPGPSALATIEYFEQVQKVTGPKVKALEANARFFLLPGVYHCRGGPGADTFDSVAALDKWVEHAQLPVNMVATRADGALSRPVCAYPTLPRYGGAGDPTLAASFLCK
jgi:feruloyl esterase